jgi:hypothetical protein
MGAVNMDLSLGKARENKYRLLPVGPVPLLFFLVLSLFLSLPAVASGTVLEITGDGVSAPVEWTLAELEAMEQYQHVYSGINTYPTKQWYIARGVKLRDLLALAGLKEEATLIRFYSRDGYDVTFTVQEILEDKRYYFPGLKENHPSDGSIPGSPAGAVEVEPIVALASAEGSADPGAMNDKDIPLLVLGQRAVTEQTSTLFVKNLSKIEVLTAEPDKWDEPRINVPAGSVLPPGTGLVLENKTSDVDKIHYTTDGSTPTVNSPIFNWSASRWWPLRGDLDQVNAPIVITEDMIQKGEDGREYIVIKARTIGPGKEDSDVVTFIFTLDPEAPDPTREPGGPVTGLSLDRSRLDLPVGGSFQLEALVEPYNAPDTRVTWHSSDTRVATVDNRGLVTVVGPGTAVITAETAEGNFTASCVINGLGEEGEDETAPLEEIPEETADEVPETELEAGEADNALAEEVGEPEEEETADPAVPEGRGQYLAEKKDLAAPSPEGGGEGQGTPAQVQVFELFLAEPLSLPVERRELELPTAIIFFLFLLSGAAKRYLEYAKEL